MSFLKHHFFSRSWGIILCAALLTPVVILSRGSLFSLSVDSEANTDIRLFFANPQQDSFTSSALLFDSFHSLSKDHSLTRRDDSYSCSASNPCSNGACCGASGYCGYGPTYCGTGCLSNCNATAECGIYASTTNKTCPLNTCCSEYGFCGTTEEFCTGGCQSNCVLHPKVPASSNSNSSVLSKVIGYYEGWQSTSTCHQTLPSDLPLAALTHINLAFAYLTTDTYEITTMSSDMPTNLFSQVTALKDQSSSLKVFVSVGGWSFSDNDTNTQPLFGDIAASAESRKTFAQNALKFMTTYGFDGLDIDWEYPGAPDRGGKERDTENYVKLMAELRSVFDASGRNLGLSFTLPSSYWYMRWFDVPGLLKYADWINFMTYDLHGTWDASDPIGNIVQGHTNLTEIKTAVELLWRVDTDPSKVVMGFGFYGRSFTLSDKSCTTPGCAFSGGGTAGVCTDTSGYLAYYEIDDILEKTSDITVVHDTSAAVLYFTWGDGQWISYDNGTTFKQKVNWANDVGLGGSMIWASDQDTYSWTAHEALLDKTLMSNSQVELQTDSSLLKELSVKAVDKSLNQQCYRGNECVDLRNPQVTCDSGYTLVGYDKSKCRKSAKYYGMPICCATASKPNSCTWRGGGRDCNGRCHEGEVTLFTSSTGGGDYDGFTSQSGTSKCHRGKKAFCCTDNEFDDLTEDCYWTGCNGKCASDETSVATASNLNGKCTVFHHKMHYCCKSNPAPLENCHWVGKGDCAQNRCSSSEVTLATNGQGDSFTSCNWWRKKSLCCTPNTVAAAGCQDVDICTIDSTLCSDYNDEYGTSLSRRDLLSGWGSDYQDEYDEDGFNVTSLETLKRIYLVDEDEGSGLHKRAAPRRPFSVAFFIDGVKHIVTMSSLNYPSIGKLWDGRNGKAVLDKAFVLASQSCGSVAVSAVNPKSASNLNTEHILDLQYIPQLMRTAITGILPSGAKMAAEIINAADFQKYMMSEVAALSQATKILSGNSLILNDRLFYQIGATTNRLGLVGTQKGLNMMKGRVFYFQKSNAEVFTGLVKSAANLNDWGLVLEKAVEFGTSEAELLTPLRLVIAVWVYLNNAEVLQRLNQVRRNIYTETKNAATYVPGMTSLPAIMKEFDKSYFERSATQSIKWVEARIEAVASEYAKAAVTPGNAEVVRATLDMLYNDLGSIKVPSLESLD